MESAIKEKIKIATLDMEDMEKRLNSATIDGDMSRAAFLHGRFVEMSTRLFILRELLAVSSK